MSPASTLNYFPALISMPIMHTEKMILVHDKTVSKRVCKCVTASHQILMGQRDRLDIIWIILFICYNFSSSFGIWPFSSYSILLIRKRWFGLFPFISSFHLLLKKNKKTMFFGDWNKFSYSSYIYTRTHKSHNYY